MQMVLQVWMLLARVHHGINLQMYLKIIVKKMFDNVKREFIQKKGGKSSQHIVDDLPPRLLTLIPYPHRITVEFLYIDQF